MSGSSRPQRVASLIWSAVDDILRRGLRDPRITSITITRVEVSGDLRHAWVHYLPLGGQGDVEVLEAGLKAARGFIRREVGRAVRLRYLPEIHFSLDLAFEASVEMIERLSRDEDEEDAFPEGST